MQDSRRSFLEELMAAGGLATLLASAAGGAQTSSTLAQGEVRSHDYWDSFYASEKGGKGVFHRKALGVRDVQFLYTDDDKQPLRFVDQIEKTELLDHPGDTTVEVMMGEFRPGTEDMEIVKNYESSQLRLDCVQTSSFLNILAPSAWVAMASLFTDKAGKLPSLQTLGFQQTTSPMSGTNKVILPNGTGKFAVNVSSMTKESKMHAILRQGVKVGGAVSPLLGFPAISIPAAEVFTALYSLLEERAAIVMSSQLTHAAATQLAVGAPDFPPSYLPLKTGQYIAVPTAHLDTVKANLSKLTVQKGYLVDTSAGTSAPVKQLALQTVPDVTYVTLKVTVSPMATSSASGSTGSGGAAGGGSSSKSTTATKKKPTTTSTKP